MSVATLGLVLGASGCSSSKKANAPVAPATTTSSSAAAPTTTFQRATTTTVAPVTTSTTVGRPDVTLFAGTWMQHGALVTVNRDGTGSATWRVYQWCQDGPPPCDSLQKNGSELDIIDGGHAQFRVVSVNRYEATFEVSHSTDPKFIPNGHVEFVLHKHDEMSIGARTPFCGPKAPVYDCGA